MQITDIYFMAGALVLNYIGVMGLKFIFKIVDKKFGSEDKMP